MAVTLSEAAARHVSRYISKRGKGVGVRLGVKTTGCSGLAYKLEYADEAAPEDVIFTSALFRGRPGERVAIEAEMARVTEAREAAQPIRERTGGSTFKNPPGGKAWQLVDAAGCRGLKLGGAQVSEKHTNFLINTGDATSADIEALGEEVRSRVKAQSGVELEWEIERLGVKK
jgi:UDP-N-acetylmuramate dehydrogenase